ncbi:MAG: methyltransferase domain-containing protein [Oligoflexia bacterium]|nr:methyltransferase domain-containing protein [Oligoflexia bacterium]
MAINGKEKEVKKVKVSSKKSYYGPVDNLEKHLHSDWWQRIFNSLYLKTDADVVTDVDITKIECDNVISTLKLEKKHDVLDLCCGQGRHCVELNQRGYTNVQGIDRSHYLIRKAKEYSRKQGLNIKFREGDARKLPYPNDSFDFVLIMGNSFGYFETIQDDYKVLGEVFRVLKPWGRLLIDIANGEYLKQNYSPRSWEWINSNLFVCRERSLSFDKERLVSRELITNVKKGVVADQFYAERLYSEEKIIRLLNEVEFINIKPEGEFVTDSKRNQDLGMMAKRITITAQVKKEWAAFTNKIEKKLKNVAVILGDPNKKDIIKPNAVCDEDDIYTIDQMKAALKSLDGYNFIFFNNHDTLLKDLANVKQDIIFALNLCDEGYNNEAIKEIHVPVYLELLGIPYTGSAPRCLAFCYDKSLIRGIAKEMGIPTPLAHFIKPEDITFDLPFSFPVIVKPNLGDSSFGITQMSVANSAEELINAIQKIRNDFGYDRSLIVEEFLTGKDISVGIIGNYPGSYQILEITEEDYSEVPPELPRICGYEAKWCPDSPYSMIKSVPANLDEETQKLVENWCLQLGERLECLDYARFDWRLDANGLPRLLEVNPNPGWCWDGHLAKMAKFSGYSYKEMLGQILEVAERRLFPVNSAIN